MKTQKEVNHKEIRRILNENGVKIGHFAKVCGMSKNTMSKMLNQGKCPKQRTQSSVLNQLEKIKGASIKDSDIFHTKVLQKGIRFFPKENIIKTNYGKLIGRIESVNHANLYDKAVNKTRIIIELDDSSNFNEFVENFSHI